MNNIPTSIDSAPVKATTGKQTPGLDTAQTESPEFGKVLASQVASPDKAASPTAMRPGRDINKEVTDQENAEPSLPTEETSTLPAEILAALVAQQGPPFATQENPAQQTQAANQADAVIQPELLQSIAITPFALNIPGMKDQNAHTALTAPDGNPVSGHMQHPAADSPLAKYTGSLPDPQGFANSAKTAGVKELSSTNSAQPVRPNGIGESPLIAQQASILPILQGTTPTSTPAVIHTPLTQPAWGEEFSQKITWMAGQRNQSAELHLNPPHLGPLDVVLEIKGDQASAIFTSPHAAVRDAIEQALPQLREMLAGSGIMLGNASVTDQAAHKSQDNSARKTRHEDLESDTGIAASKGVAISLQRRHNGLIDTFA